METYSLRPIFVVSSLLCSFPHVVIFHWWRRNNFMLSIGANLELVITPDPTLDPIHTSYNYVVATTYSSTTQKIPAV
jgi:hypothetical protein